MDDRAPLLEQGRLLADHLLAVPRAEDAPLYRPDDPRYRHTVWVDSIYHVPPFLARLGRVTGEARWYAAALAEQAAHLRVLTPAGSPFPAHAYDTGARSIHGPGWGRGVGWALLGMVDTLSLVPADHPRYGEAQAELRALAEAVLALQDPTGCWRTVIDDREAYLESSTAAMFCAAFTKGARLGLLDQDPYADAAEKAWRYVEARVDEDGSFWGVSACTWASTAGSEDAAMYRALPTEVNVWGQGAAMRAAAERLRAQETAPAAAARSGSSTGAAPDLQPSH
jgi:unsaturated rhamnogalacturonyl hydrolase